MKLHEPRATVIPRYWGDGSRFAAGPQAEHWSWRRQEAKDCRMAQGLRRRGCARGATFKREAAIPL